MMAGSKRTGVGMVITTISGATMAGIATGRRPTPDAQTAQTDAPDESLPLARG
jgi:hypothetical protein